MVKYPRKTKKIMKSKRPVKKYISRSKPKYALTNYPFPTTTIKKLKYVEQININPLAGTVGTYSFIANSLYDPSFTTTGNRRPYGFDQLMALYNHFTVLGSKITVNIATSQYADGIVLGIKLDDVSGIMTTEPAKLLELPYFKRVISNNNSTRNMSITHSFSAKKFFGDKMLAKSYNDTLSGSYANSPVDMAYFNICVAPFTSAQDIPSLPLLVEVEYIAKFFEPKDLPSSL